MFLKVILLSVLIVSCNKSSPTKEVTLPTIEVTPSPVAYTKVNIVKLTGFTTAQAARFIKVAGRVEEIINSEAFKTKVLGFTHKGKKQFFDTIQGNSLVLHTLTYGSWSLEYRLEDLGRSSDVIGYTYPSVKWIALNKRKYDELKDSEIARNIVHETSHKLGYKHTMEYTSNRPFSVPYAVGEIVKTLY